MKKSDALKPTDRELEILGVLWEEGLCTIRQVHEILNQRERTGYTTVLKMMQVMTDKGLVRRDDSDRAHVYEARFSRGETQRTLVSDLVKKAFGGSAPRLVMQALDANKISRKELDEIQAMLDEYRGGQS